MSPEAIIAGLVAFIGTLFGVISYLGRLHLKDDEQRDKDLESAKAVAATSTTNVTTLIPAVQQLTATVTTVDERAEERYRNIQSQAADQHKKVLAAIRAQSKTAR